MARFGRRDWLALGRVALAEGGPSALTIEALTARAKLTRGSFYHHFADRAAFVAALAGEWAEEVAALSPDRADPALERALRGVPEAAEAVRAADAARRGAFRALLPIPDGPEAEDYAEVAFCVFLGALARPEIGRERLAALLRLVAEMAAARWNE